MAAARKKRTSRKPPRRLGSAFVGGDAAADPPAPQEPPKKRERGAIVLEKAKSLDGKVIREVVRKRMAESQYALAVELVDAMIDMALDPTAKASDRQRSIDKLLQYHEPPPPQEKPKPAEMLPPQKVRKHVVLDVRPEDLEGLPVDSPAFDALKKHIDLQGAEEPDEPEDE